GSSCKSATWLFPRAGRQRRLEALLAAHVDDFYRLADLQHLERVSVVVDIGDGLPGNLDDDVALPQPGLLGRSAADDAAEEQTLHVGRVVGDRAGEDANAGAPRPALH